MRGIVRQCKRERESKKDTKAIEERQEQRKNARTEKKTGHAVTADQLHCLFSYFFRSLPFLFTQCADG